MFESATKDLFRCYLGEVVSPRARREEAEKAFLFKEVMTSSLYFDLDTLIMNLCLLITVGLHTIFLRNNSGFFCKAYHSSLQSAVEA